MTPSPDRGRVAAKVTFVVSKGEVLAVFRAIRGAHGRWERLKTGRLEELIDCYAHAGQHGECAASLLKCRRATYEEYAPLLKEMRDIGYDVDVVQRGRIRLREETGYAAMYADHFGNDDFGCYRVFRSRGDALDYLTDTVFERAETLDVDVIDLDSLRVDDDLADATKMTWSQVRDRLAQGYPFALGLRFDQYNTAVENTSMMVEEVTIC